MEAPRTKVLLLLKSLSFLMISAISFSACAQIQMSGGKGQVLDSTTRQPVEGATVTLDCQRSLLHGATKIRNVEVVSDKAGMYVFSFPDVAGCDFAYVRVRKSGYEESGSIHTGYAYTSYSKIPQFRFLTPDADVVMLRLTAITPSPMGSALRLDNTPAYASEYRSWYAAFLQARDIAKTDREKQFVRERYCENLPKLRAALNDKEKVELADPRVVYSYSWRGTFKQSKHDYEAEVLPYCAG